MAYGISLDPIAILRGSASNGSKIQGRASSQQNSESAGETSPLTAPSAGSQEISVTRSQPIDNSGDLLSSLKEDWIPPKARESEKDSSRPATGESASAGSILGRWSGGKAYTTTNETPPLVDIRV